MAESPCFSNVYIAEHGGVLWACRGADANIPLTDNLSVNKPCFVRLGRPIESTNPTLRLYEFFEPPTETLFAYAIELFHSFTFLLMQSSELPQASAIERPVVTAGDEIVSLLLCCSVI